MGREVPALAADALLDWDKESYSFEFLQYTLRHGSPLPRSFLAVPHGIVNYPALFHSVSYWGNHEVLTVSPFFRSSPGCRCRRSSSSPFSGHDFELHNARVAEQDRLGTTFEVQDASQPVEIRPRVYHRGILFLGTLVLYGLVLGTLWAVRAA